jgi:hypothetical protein
VKVKNCSYWRRDAEIEVMERARKRRAAAFNPVKLRRTAVKSQDVV